MEKVIKNRYEIIRPVGSGGMAEVFLAHDNLLDRNVAVKMLRDQFVADKDLLEQFKTEAKSAARLIHPYIINIYDVISEGDIQYIIMEYVDGITLKDYLKEHKLPLNAVLEIAVRLADALKHAHSRNIIHCDIKPQNILIDKNLNPKITDFGIAKMISNQTMVYTSAVMGSVHYISPEQANGEQITACSDIYSLGVVLFEMLTGKVPYNGNTAVSVAMMHAEKPIPQLSDYMEDVPEGLQEIINKALAKKSVNRYQTAEELRKDLMSLKMKLYPFSSDEYKKDMQEVLPVKAEADKPEDMVNGETLIMKPRRSMPDTVEEPAEADEIISAEPEDSMAKKIIRKKKSLSFTKVLMAVTVLVVIISAIAHLLFNHSREEVIVPEVTEMQVSEAQILLEDKGFEVELEERYVDDAKPGVVIEQSPKAGEKRKEGSVVYLSISKGAELKAVPEVLGMSLVKAERIILEAGYEVGKVVKKYDRDKKLGSVIEQTPKAKDKAPKGSKINLIINEGDIKVPEVVGKKLTDATKILQNAKLSLGNVKYIRNERPKNTVISSTPSSGASLTEGEEVDLLVSEGDERTVSNAYVDFVVPGDKKQHVQIYVLDSRGRSLVYDGDKKGGVRIRQKIDAFGSAKVQFYCDNKLVEEKNL